MVSQNFFFMKDKKQQPDNSLSRRNFLAITSAASIGLGAAPIAGLHAEEKVAAKKKYTPPPPEWRNRQESMSYRMLGRTGMMISEIVNGGDPVRLDNLRPTEVAMERGLNYLDMAPAYGRGECEQAYAKIINSSSKREKIFMTTKVSGFSGVRNRMYREIFDALPSEKQRAIEKRAQEIRAERMVDKPGYYFTYWPGQERSMDGSFLSTAMMKDYAHKVEGSKEYRDFIVNSLEESLKRVGIDYFDILMCPHGANCAEEVQIPEIWETFAQLKKDGKVRFLGVSTHNDPAGVLRAAADTDMFDVCMCAYNIANGGYMDDAIRYAHQEKNMGVIGMKAAMAVATHHTALQPIPQWRIDKVQRIVPGDMKAPMKAYLWALQNPNISAVISNLWDENFVEDNLSLAGMKVKLNAG
jgi:aryl-alcohol dehydrogenase-like predicted oxidoreductase